MSYFKKTAELAFGGQEEEMIRLNLPSPPRSDQAKATAPRITATPRRQGHWKTAWVAEGVTTQSAVRALICLLSWTLLPAGTQPNDLVDQDVKPREIVRCGSTDAATPSGLAVVLPSQNYQSPELEAVNNAFISGVAVQINWRDIEPVEGKPDWSKLDELFAAAASANKWVQIAIFPGFFSPAWALEGAKTDQFPIPYGPGHGTVTSLPMPWDRIYLGRWFAFVKQLGKRYGTSPAFRMIAAAGPTSVSEEMTLPNGQARSRTP
jgi:hypothetical protein